MTAIRSLADVVAWDLCTGCGACYFACPKGAVTLVNIESSGIRPVFKSPGCGECRKCLDICPGYSVDVAAVAPSPATEAEHSFGNALEIWEGYASDPAIRFKASSGGILSALSLYCLEYEGMDFVLHTGTDKEKPWENRTVKSRSRRELLERAGSRYSPASPCEGLKAVEESESPCVFIGKPCDVAAVSALRKENPGLDKKLGLVLSFFCAGTPSTQGTLEVAQSLNVLPSQITSLRYRGNGWPGRFSVQYGSAPAEASLSYEESWGALTKYRPLRCNLCPDGLGRMADISCGDAWHDKGGKENPGLSLVIVRTARGKRILRDAIAAGYVVLWPAEASHVMSAQVNLLQRRRELFGRLAALRIFGIPYPDFKGFSLLHSWLQLPFRVKLRTLLGTARRIVKRRLYVRRPKAGLTAQS